MATGPESADIRWMRVALGLARRSLGRVSPNPGVSALLVKNGVVLGRGVTAPGGRPHAETLAIDQARARYGDAALRGATAYVTLEPCNHHGKTPPCTEALISAGIGRLVSPIEDPDPRVSGSGFARLREAGIAVETGVMAAEARRLHRGFLSRIERGRPYTTLKLAATLDGRIATGSGESRWITGPEARRRVHLMRAQADAVLVGAGTAQADDPMLDVRGFGADVSQPLRVVADSRLSLPMASRLAQSAADVPLWLLHGPRATEAARDALASAGARLIEVPAVEGGIDLEAGLRALAGLGISRLMCEGGGGLAASLVRAGLADELWLFQAGKAIGAEGSPALGPLGLDNLAEAPHFALETVERLGDDILSRWRAG